MSYSKEFLGYHEVQRIRRKFLRQIVPVMSLRSINFGYATYSYDGDFGFGDRHLFVLIGMLHPSLVVVSWGNPIHSHKITSFKEGVWSRIRDARESDFVAARLQGFS